MSNTTDPRLQAWISHIFDHPVAEDIRKAWYWAEDAPTWEGTWEDVPTLIAERFERSWELLEEFSDAALDQGFWFLVGSSPEDFRDSLLDSRIPMSARVRAIASFTPLFEQVMVARCSENLSHLDAEASVLNGSCYMWWDLLWYALRHDLEDLPIASEIHAALRRQLTMPHDACRESALHGIGHWVKTFPDMAHLVDEFLAANPGIRPELVAYAAQAKIGRVL